MRSYFLVVAALFAAVALAMIGAFAGCGQVQNIHDTDEGRNNPCVSCHRSAFVAAASPKHLGVTPEMPDTCQDCHTTQAWAPTTAEDHGKFGFPIKNKHAAPPAGLIDRIACTKCHTKGYRKGDTSNACVSCHQKDYDGAKNPPHAGYSTDCATCHDDTGWRPAKFVHSWPLEGKHTATSCFSCHTGNPPVYKGTPKDCVGCHQKNYDDANAAKKPARLGGHAPLLPTTCADCHSANGWTPLARNIHQSDTAKTTICSACHINDYNGVVTPKHVGVFPTQCAGCHGTAAWKPAINVSHDWFPLNNKHATLACVSCHKNNVFTPGTTPNTCVGCHQANYDFAATAQAAIGHNNFSTNCKGCHNDAAWKPFSHGWPRTGKHAPPLACAKCHGVGADPLTAPRPSTACFSCHQANYTTASSIVPGHGSFSQICTDCHTTNGWKPALAGAHPEAKFPITTGAHKIFTCVDCHNPALGASTGGKNTDCIGCHTGQHRRTSMDAKHAGVKNYPTGAAPPNFCLACHPNGKN